MWWWCAKSGRFIRRVYDLQISFPGVVNESRCSANPCRESCAYGSKRMDFCLGKLEKET